MSVTVKGVTRKFGAVVAVDDVSFEVPGGELVTLLGPSGSGKSTLLRIIAGLEPADAGRVELAGVDATELTPQARGVGFVFQHYALFRHMTVHQNVAFGLEVRKVPRIEARERVDELLALVRMSEYADRYPTQLSGGQRQRVALARALAPKPTVLLLDEPFGALDAKVREALRSWLRRLHEQTHVTTLLVTHDQQEAFEVSDRVVLLNRGRVEQVGLPQELYDRPTNPFVSEFLGATNLLRGHSEQGSTTVLGTGLTLPTSEPGPDGPVSVYLRPHDFDVTRLREAENTWPATVTRLTPLGALVRVVVGLADGTNLGVELTLERFQELALSPGDDVFLTPKAPKLFRAAERPVEEYVV